MASITPESFRLIDQMTDGEIQKLFEHILETRGDRFKDFINKPQQIIKGDIEYGKKALDRMRSRKDEVAFRPEGRIRAQELDDAGELTGMARDYDMATGQERATIRKMRMDGMGAGPRPLLPFERISMPRTLNLRRADIPEKARADMLDMREDEEDLD